VRHSQRSASPSSSLCRTPSIVGPQKLVEAARELLQTVAPANLTAARVAKAAGADRALIRYYFGSMSNLLAEVATQLSRGLVSNLAEASKGEDRALCRLKRRIHEFVRYELDNPALQGSGSQAHARIMAA
jgi:AcrR family transcriptional regulator